MNIQTAFTRLVCVFGVIIGFAAPDIAARAASFALTGDSTVASGSGWGDSLIKFLPAGITVNNKARSGYSTKSFIDGGYWQAAVDTDSNYVFIQFGHNDQKLNEPLRGTYPVATRPAGVTARANDMFRSNLLKMVDEVQARGGTPILVTPLARRNRSADAYGVLQFQNDAPSSADALGNRYSLRDYAEAAIAVATQKNLSVIDLNQLSLDLYNQMLANGEDIATLGPAGDSTHLNETGAKAIAELIGNEIRVMLPESLLATQQIPRERISITFTNELDQAADYGSFTTLVNNTTGNASVNTSDLGGTPNEVQVQTLIESAGSARFSLMSAAIFDPSTLDGIGCISWSTEIRKVAGADNDAYLTPAIMQNGTLYLYTGTAITGGAMADAFRATDESYSLVELKRAKAADFLKYGAAVGSSYPPNFSRYGADITFGYYTYAATGSTGFDRRSAIRNGKISVTAPSPTISTADGNGADTQTDEFNKLSNSGGSTHINARWYLNLATPRNENIILRFDLSAIGSATITNASLELVKYRNAGAATMVVYGLIDGQPGDALEDWSEGTLTYAKAPWIDQDDEFDDNDLIATSVVKLDNAFPALGKAGDIMSSSQTTNLTNFLQSDRNGLVTFIITRENTSTGTQEKFASKEATALDDNGGSGIPGWFAPRLRVELQYPDAGTLIILQ